VGAISGFLAHRFGFRFFQKKKITLITGQTENFIFLFNTVSAENELKYHFRKKLDQVLD
jgi:hypothetical protein